MTHSASVYAVLVLPFSVGLGKWPETPCLAKRSPRAYRDGYTAAAITQHNFSKRVAQAIPGRSVSVPSAPEWGIGADITSAAEGGQPFANGITDPQAAVAVALHFGDLMAGEQRVRHELVVAEHREVESARHSSIFAVPSTLGGAA